MADTFTLKNVAIRVVKEPGAGTEVFLTCPDPLLNTSFYSKDDLDIKQGSGELVWTRSAEAEKAEAEEHSTEEKDEE